MLQKKTWIYERSRKKRGCFMFLKRKRELFRVHEGQEREREREKKRDTHTHKKNGYSVFRRFLEFASPI